MPANRKRYAQAVPVVYICIGIGIAVCIVGFCVKALILQHQVRQGGERLRRLQKEFAEVNIKNEALQTKKDQLTSTPALQKAIKDGFVKLVKIEDQFVVHVGTAGRRVAVASSEGGGR